MSPTPTPASPVVTRRFLTFAKSLAHWTSKVTASTSVRHSAPVVVFGLAGVRTTTLVSCDPSPSVNDRVVVASSVAFSCPMSRLVGHRSASGSAYCAGTASGSGGMPNESAGLTIVRTRAACGLEEEVRRASGSRSAPDSQAASRDASARSYSIEWIRPPWRIRSCGRRASRRCSASRC